MNLVNVTMTVAEVTPGGVVLHCPIEAQDNWIINMLIGTDQCEWQTTEGRPISTRVFLKCLAKGSLVVVDGVLQMSGLASNAVVKEHEAYINRIDVRPSRVRLVRK